MDDHWLDGDFAVMKIDLRNVLNLVSRQAVLNAIPQNCCHSLPGVMGNTLYMAHTHTHTLGSITSESGVQQVDPLGPLLFCLVLHQVVCAIATDSECASLLFYR